MNPIKSLFPLILSFVPLLSAQTAQETLGEVLRTAKEDNVTRSEDVPLSLSPRTTARGGEDELQEAYILRRDDHVQLHVFGEPELNVVAEIGRDGSAVFPLIDDPVTLRGLTLPEAKKKIHDLYEFDLLVNPNIGLTVAKYAQEAVIVSGQVVDPRPVPIPDHGRLSLFTAITNAGGLSGFADDKAIQVFSARGGDPKNYTLEQIRGEIGKTTLLSPGDQIVVPKNRHANSVVSVQGEVSNPTNVKIPKSGRLELGTVWTAVKGITKEGDPNRIKLIHSDGDKVSYFTKKEIEEGNAGRLRLRGGERLIVPKSPWIGKTVLVEGEVGNPGYVSFPASGELTLKEAIIKAGGFGQLANQKVILKRQGFQPKVYDLDDLAKAGQVLPLSPDDTITAKRRIF